MSRIGKVPISVPEGVQFSLDEFGRIAVEGKHGKMEFTIPAVITCEYRKFDQSISTKKQCTGEILCRMTSDNIDARAKWGLTRSIVANMIEGVDRGFQKVLEINGVGFKASASGQLLTLYLGHSHDIVYAVPKGINVKCDKPTVISIFGCSKQLVGQVAAEIRGLKKAEPYKGKGIKYSDEIVRRKAGKKK